MLRTCHPQPHVLFSKHVLHFNPLIITTNTCFQSYDFAPKFPSIVSSLSRSVRTHAQKRVICAKRSKRRRGSQKSRKFMLQLLSVLASNLSILPQPLDLVIQEFNGGEGGGLGFWKGYGGGEGFGWWRRRKKGTLWFIMILVISSSLFLLHGKELNRNVIYAALGLSSLASVFVKGLKRNVKDWFFGLCFFGALVGLGWNRQKAMKWVNESRVCPPVVEIFAGGKRKGRRAI